MTMDLQRKYPILRVGEATVTISNETGNAVKG